VLVKGGTGVVGAKNLVTPLGVATEISEDEIGFLESNPLFRLHAKNGYVTIQRRKADPERVAADMNTKDQSAQKSEADYANAGDANLSAGWLPTAVKQTISLMPDSPSYAIFETWHGAQATQREVMQASAVIVIPSLNKTYTCTKGFLTSVKLMPDAKKVMEGSQFQITWNFITPANN